MLRAKQKKAEEEARAKAAAAEAAATPMDVATENGTGNGLAASGGAETKAGGEQVRLLGIGGQSVKPMAAKGKRRQPAELRIQKGEYRELLSLFVLRNHGVLEIMICTWGRGSLLHTAWSCEN